MMLKIPGVVPREALALITETLEKARFVDGKLSAGAEARRVKNNEELPRDAAEIKALNDVVMGALVRNDLYQRAALPYRVAAPYYARYEPGRGYGSHVDDPVMGAGGALYRSDVAVTVFLSAPEDYDGGELTIQTAYGTQQVKLPAGDAVLYPASSWHGVAEVTRGVRLVAVTWVQSMIRDPARRELLFNLSQAREKLLRERPEAEETALVSTSYTNLVRMWAEV